MTDATDNSSNDPIATINTFSAETLLGGTAIMEQVKSLRDSLSRESDGTFIGYDDMFLRIQKEVDGLPTLELLMNIPAGTEGAYQRQLLHALEQINDDHDRVLRKVIKLKSRLLNAITLMSNKRTQFAAFYNLAISVAINNGPKGSKVKISAPHSKEMAAAEFSDLMDRLDILAPSLVSELEILEVEIKMRKKGQADKYQLGKDQVSAMWNSIQSNGAISMDDDPNSLLKKFPVEDDDEIPSYVSKYSKEIRVTASETFQRPPVDKDEITPLNTRCSVCGSKQSQTYSGVTCPQGHGGAESLDEDDGEIVGVFVKQGDPKPITAIVDDGGGEAVIEVPKDISKEEIAQIRVSMEALKDDPDFNPPISDPNPSWHDEVSAKELLTQEIVTEPEEVKVISKQWFAELSDSILNPTKAVEIEDVPDMAHDMAAGTLDDDEGPTLQEALEEAGFKPVETERIILPEGARVVEDLDILNEPEPIATPAFATPRKKLMLIEDEELF